jgi:hypothetical protein
MTELEPAELKSEVSAVNKKVDNVAESVSKKEDKSVKKDLEGSSVVVNDANAEVKRVDGGGHKKAKVVAGLLKKAADKLPAISDIKSKVLKSKVKSAKNKLMKVSKKAEKVSKKIKKALMNGGRRSRKASRKNASRRR